MFDEAGSVEKCGANWKSSSDLVLPQLKRALGPKVHGIDEAKHDNLAQFDTGDLLISVLGAVCATG